MEPRRAVEDSKPEEILVEEAEESPPDQEVTPVLHRPPPDHGIGTPEAAQRRPAFGANADPFHRLARAVVVVLGKPPRQSAIETVMDEVAFQFPHRAFDDGMDIGLANLVRHAPRPDQADDPDRIARRMLDPAAEIHVLVSQPIRRMFSRRIFGGFDQFFGQVFGHAFVSIANVNPVILVLDLVQREVSLLIFGIELSFEHPHIGERLGDLAGAVGGMGIDHDNVVGKG